METMTIQKYFDSGGKLSEKLPGYEHRPQQIEMAAQVADSLENPSI